MIQFERPRAHDGARLFFQENPIPDHTIRLRDKGTVIVQIRLYRWFSEEWERTRRQQSGKANPDFSGLILKNDLVGQITCRDHPQISKHHVGKILRMVVPYKVHFQRNPSKATDWENLTFWRWNHPLDIVYGLEHLLLKWLPEMIEADGGSCSNAEEFEEELEVLREQSFPEDIAFASAVLKRSAGGPNLRRREDWE